jgi:hypothetical protein
MLNSKDHSNIGIILFQQLFFNAAEMRQPDFAATAEFYFRRWKRHQLGYEYRMKMISWSAYRSRWVRNLLNQVILGYGVRARYFLVSSLVFLCGLVIINHALWDKLSINIANSKLNASSWTATTYFTIVSLATLGYGDITPTSDFGMRLISVESLLGFVWLGCLLSLIVKKVIR